MSATSLKLPEGLKRRIARLAGAANKTAHAFMVEVLSQEADRAEIREVLKTIVKGQQLDLERFGQPNRPRALRIGRSRCSKKRRERPSPNSEFTVNSSPPEDRRPNSLAASW